MTHALPDPDRDALGAVTAERTVGLSPKAVAAAVAPLALGVVLSAFFAVLDYVVGNPDLLAGLPAWVQVAVSAALSALVAGTAAYRARPGVVIPESGSHRV